MALVLNDRVKETTTTTGTGTINLAGAETGFETFVQGIGNSNTTYYAIVHTSANEFEVGLGTVTDASPDTLSRTTIISSTNSDSAVDFSAGTKNVFCTLPASKAVVIPTSGDMIVDVPGDIIFDADGGDILFKDAGTLVGTIGGFAGNNVTIKSEVSDGDVIFQGNDGGSGITALTLDMSEAGVATFNSAVVAGTNFEFTTAGRYIQFIGSSSTFWAVGSSGGSNPPGTASTSLAFHHFDGSAWNNEVEFDSSGNITLDGNIVFSNNSKVRQDSAGLILETLDSDEDIFFSGNDGGSAITAVRIDMSDAGHLICNGNITAFGNTSDIKLKENIKVIPDALDKVKQLKGITFNYKKDGKRSTGLIAQDLEKVLPEAIYETIDADINGDPEDKHLAIRYGNTVGLLVEAIKELEARVKELEDK